MRARGARNMQVVGCMLARHLDSKAASNLTALIPEEHTEGHL